MAGTPAQPAYPGLLPERLRETPGAYWQPLRHVTSGDLQGFAQSLIGSCLAPISRANPGGREEPVWVLPPPAVLSLDPAAEWTLPDQRIVKTPVPLVLFS